MGTLLSRSTAGFDTENDLLDLTGKVVVVTGANTGIGYHTVKFLARRGAKVYLGARNEEKALQAIKNLNEDGIGKGHVEWLYVNFDDPRCAKTNAEEFLKRENRLDILVNNAAQLSGPYHQNEDGVSNLMAINHFGPYVFTRTLLPLMLRTSQEADSDVRIITLSSAAHRHDPATNPDIKFREAEDFNQEFPSYLFPEHSRYCLTKLANILFALELQRKLDSLSLPILSIPIHPGAVNTFADLLPFPFIAKILLTIFLATPAEGAYNSCFAAASPKVREHEERFKGEYLVPVGVVSEKSQNAKRLGLAMELWETTEELLKSWGVTLPEVGEVAQQ